MKTTQAFRCVAVAVILAAGVGLAAPTHAVPANGQVIADSVSASGPAEPVRLLCTWGCAEFKTSLYGKVCVKRTRNCSMTPELRRFPPPAPSHR